MTLSSSDSLTPAASPCPTSISTSASGGAATSSTTSPNLYGRDSVCQIITFGTLASKAAIKDVGRALEMPYSEVDRIAKLIPPPVRGRNVSLTQALEQVPELRKEIETNPNVKDLMEIAQRLEGCARHSSVHAAGVVISPVPLRN